LSCADLDAVLRAAPAAPGSVSETGLRLPDLLNLTIKAMYTSGAETTSAIVDIVKLPNRVVQLVLEQAKERKLLDALGAASIRVTSELRYALTEKGKQWALDAIGQNQYVGPAPVSLDAYRERIDRQRITGEEVNRTAVDRAFAGLEISESFVQQIGPALNSGRSILIYGPPGNGKTTVAERIGAVFQDVIYIPYCFEVEGQTIKVFDPGIHQACQENPETSLKGAALRREDFDARWVPCRRPFIVAGGELTLEMLDLSFNPIAGFYEAPLHVKALGGIFMIDDFGRQIVSPQALLNRWIVPLERRIDYLKLHTGKSFSLPFDELVIFSTNLAPQDLMDPAFLRRIPYKIEIGAPSVAQYRQIFFVLSKTMGIEVSDETVDSVVTVLRDRGGIPLASYQPKFILEQVTAACRFACIAPQIQPELLARALGNLSVGSATGNAPSSRV
jgi:predicted ATPase with chaperone activity